MQYFIGIDGGGTKTTCLLCDETGTQLASATDIGTSHRHSGIDNAVQTVSDLVKACATKTNILPSNIAVACFGLPCYGEDLKADASMRAALDSIAQKTIFANDTEIGWAGSFACGSGINLVSGTGSIAYGRNEKGEAFRSGGWSEVFGDEGSSYWLGIKCMQLFSKQADGRIPKSVLYDLICQKYSLKNDFDFAVMAHSEWLAHRDKVAQFQKLLSDAADDGDKSANELYRQAAYELAQLANAVKSSICFNAGLVPVSYSGGTFRAGEKLIVPMQSQLFKLGMVLKEPLLSPVQGAVLLAAEAYSKSVYESVRTGLQGCTSV